MNKPMQVALIGHPNVGKSVVFSKLTGVTAISSNYPGTTVEYLEGKVVHEGQVIEIFDLPGTYGLSGASEDEKVATRLLAEREPDCVVVVADATRLEPSLVLAFQIIELGYRTILLLNQMDVARKRITIDVEQLSGILGIPIIPSVAISGEGLDGLVESISSPPRKPSTFKVRYDSHIEAMLEKLTSELTTYELPHPKRGAILKLLEGNEFFTAKFDDEFRAKAENEMYEFRQEHGEDIEVHMNRDRYGEAGKIISEVVGKIPRQLSRRERISELTLKPWPGIPLMLVVLTGVFICLVFIGSALETFLVAQYAGLTAGFFDSLAHAIGGQLGASIANGLNLTMMSIVAIVIPYILVFYLVLAILEDSGYLPRVVILLDGLMQKLGLSGRSIIPMIVGTGCNVPAILSTRVLGSRRERLILSTIIILAVPCGAQTVVILGTVGAYGGLIYVAAIYAILLALILLSGWFMHHFMRSEPIGLMIEVPELAVPQLDNVLDKTYNRVKDFFVIAFPILLVTSFVLELLMNFGVMNALVEPFSWLTVGLLGLPAITIIALLFGILRKEMSLQLLVVLFGTADLITVMTVDQMFVFALVIATYIPCASAFSVMFKEFGLKDTAKVTVSSIAISFLIGGVANLLLSIV
ncbi:MAG: hypothetical protein A4E32_00104 [Methanomassiliicoccales archaeon PtaU1.Bin124]|nr:MAG: hypothetical protein A4E32_00104 [Methanomassiliicoccales archaeon PtaU1.Bin124]